MAPVSYVPGISGQEVSSGSGHGAETCFGWTIIFTEQKCTSKVPIGHLLRIISSDFIRLAWPANIPWFPPSMIRCEKRIFQRRRVFKIPANPESVFHSPQSIAFCRFYCRFYCRFSLPFGRTNLFMLSDKWTEELRIEGLRNSEIFFCCSLAHSPESGLNLQVKYLSACPIEGCSAFRSPFEK